MSKPTVYLDTNIFSILHYRGGDAGVLRRQRATHEWWEQERHFFSLLASKAVEGELANGDYPGKERALAEVRRLPYLDAVAAVQDVAAKLLAAQVVPETVPGDAIQLAFATVYRVDYLLSWNRVIWWARRHKRNWRGSERHLGCARRLSYRRRAFRRLR